MTAAPPAATRTTPPIDRVPARGRAVRTAVTVGAGLVLLWGTLWGSDDLFPFGPFKMYANANQNDGVVRSSRVEAVDADGHRFKLTDSSTGMRRAEIEGQLPRFRAHPALLRSVAEAYTARHPGAPPLVLVEILQLRYELVDGKPSGHVTEHRVAAWTAPGHEDLADAGDGAGDDGRRDGGGDG